MRVPVRQWRFVGWFLAFAFLAGGSGAAYEYARLGGSAAAATDQVTNEVRQAFSEITSTLEQAATGVAREHDLVVRAATDPAAARTLFDLLNQWAKDDRAVTVYGADGTPLAWSGRPSDLPRPSVSGPEALLIAPGPSGPRLVRVQPVTGEHPERPGEVARRVGSIVAETPLPVTRPN
ncbi:MAG: hypothetical protein NTY02_15735, partial [Acidobacteria bacterium]|nr:hypothetical protein [Acidobacteriota bacterium]